MYSMVLMAAMVPSGDVASFGKHKGGCNGAGCTGTVVYMAAPTGCHGGGKHKGSGCHGGGFLGSRSGCHGGGFLGSRSGCHGGGLLRGHKGNSCCGYVAPTPCGCCGTATGGAAVMPPPPTPAKKPASTSGKD